VGSPATPPKDFLAVDIPETKMERYSVMFNGILPNQPGGLLARRQSKRENKRPEEVESAIKVCISKVLFTNCIPS
jgi:hypothetical protein